MADKLIQTFTQNVTVGSTYAFTHSLTAAGASVAPDIVPVVMQGAVWGARTNFGVPRLIGANTNLISVAIDGLDGGGGSPTTVGTVVVTAQKRHSIVNVT